MESWTFKTQIFTESVNHSATGSKLDALERLRLLNGERIFIVCDPFLEGTSALQTVIGIKKRRVYSTNSDWWGICH